MEQQLNEFLEFDIFILQRNLGKTSVVHLRLEVALLCNIHTSDIRKSLKMAETCGHIPQIHVGYIIVLLLSNNVKCTLVQPIGGVEV
jgi:hypothetical protein